MVQTRRQIVTGSSKVNKGTNRRRYITIHETANRSVGANAAAHANLQSRGNVRNASWHWQVDDHEAVQSFEHTARCWHAGDGSGPGNSDSIAIEVCVNADGDTVQAYRNAAELVRQIMAQEGIPLANVVQHNRWSGKNCPMGLRTGAYGMTWATFLSLVAGAPVTPTPKPRPTPTTGDAIMASLPVLNWSKQRTNAPDAMDRRVQALLKAAGHYRGALDGYRGPLSLAALRSFQIATNTGDGKGGADMFVGPKTWRALLGV